MVRSLWVRRLAAVSTLAVIAAACGGDDDEGTTAETGTAGTETAVDTGTATDTGTEATGTAAAPTAEADGSLQLGYILPETGPLAFLGPPQIEAVQLAVNDINAAGGVLDGDVTLATGDEAGDPTVASQTSQRLLGEGVDAIVGAAASGMSLAIIDAVTGAGVVQCSASNTSPTFTNYDDGGLYFRTAPSDALQGPVLAEAMINDGYTNVALMARADDYGRGLLEATSAALQEQGATIATEVTYDPEAASFDAEVQQVAGSGADAVAVIAFDEGAQIIQGLIESGMGPDSVGLYGADGLRGTELPTQVDPNNAGVLAGMQGTAPASEASDEFIQRFQSETGVDDTTFAAAAYDCTTLIALAAQAADSDAGEEIANQMVPVSKEGEQCSSFEECTQLLSDGTDIDYQGVSGPVDLIEEGEPSTGTYEVWRFTEDGQIETVTTVESTLEG